MFCCICWSHSTSPEIAIVSESLDTLATALDMIEERADRIRAQLLELLTSNREILSLIREENSKLLDPDDSTTRERHDSDH